jgi:hypothetical protein
MQQFGSLSRSVAQKQRLTIGSGSELVEDKRYLKTLNRVNRATLQSALTIQKISDPRRQDLRSSLPSISHASGHAAAPIRIDINIIDRPRVKPRRYALLNRHTYLTLDDALSL